MNSKNYDHLISICIPTFSRQSFLKNILTQLIELVEIYDLNIEVCVSDNCSTDNTWEFLKEISENRNYIKLKSHDRNIGGNRNLIDITSMATSNWILVIGDDDMIIREGLIKLIEFLPKLEQFDYVLLNTKLDDETNLLNLRNGPQDISSLKRSLVRSINEYGFCGSHLMTSDVAKEMRIRNYEDLRTWPSFGTFIYSTFHLDKKIYFFETPVVWQDANGQAMTWQPNHWLRLMVRMLNVFLINLNNYSDDSFRINVIKNNISSTLFFKSFYRSLIYLKKDTLDTLKSEEYKNLISVLPWYTKIRNIILISFIRMIPNQLTLFIIKRILNKNVNDYVYTGNLDEKDGISQDPDILTKSNE